MPELAESYLSASPYVSLPKNWTHYYPNINDEKSIILGYENK
jgi:hypothetical protein